MASEDLYIVVCRRGNLETAFPFTREGIKDATAQELAWDFTKIVGNAQLVNPGRLTNPLDLKSWAGLGLFLPERDSPLLPLFPLKPQLEGQWRTGEAIPERARVDLPKSFSAPWLYLDLKETTAQGIIYL